MKFLDFSIRPESFLDLRVPSASRFPDNPYSGSLGFRASDVKPFQTLHRIRRCHSSYFCLLCSKSVFFTDRVFGQVALL